MFLFTFEGSVAVTVEKKINNQGRLLQRLRYYLRQERTFDACYVSKQRVFSHFIYVSV